MPRGTILGLLGPNGAGKTSLIRIITTITQADSGRILFDGEPLSTYHPGQIGYLPEERGLYKKMKVGEHLIYLASLKGLDLQTAKDKINHWMERFEMTDWWEKKVDELSKGMQQKVQFVSTIVHDPKLIILDEPFSGLDPLNTKLIKEEIGRLQENGMSVIFSTHRMEQVEELCDYIALMNKGELMLEDEITKVRKDFQKEVYHIGFYGNKEAINDVPGLTVLELTDKHAMVELEGGEQDRNQLLRRLADSPLEILNFSLHLPRLNEIFIELVGGNIHASE